ncbi:MAG: bifunctional riboflavin kinase/FAD synthetase [Bacillota bacterium]|nr:bifunctional riboflavin kinase/FAD synthetase [Bacillota bacterium]
MEIIRINYRNIPELPKSVACIGFFDGIHRGHQALLKKSISWAKEKNMYSSMITFDPDPWKVFFPQKVCEHLTTIRDRVHIAKKIGIDYVYVLTFSKGFAANSVEDFHEILHKMNIQALVCGFDFQYASKNSGNVHTLQNQSYFEVEVVSSINEEDQKISSSRIEPLVKSGDVLKANQLLGYVYSLSGYIGHGFKRGTNILRIPTANLNLKDEYVLPQVAVYSGMVSFEDCIYPAMINVGRNPTFDNELLTIEAHIIGFNGDLYDKNARFFFLNKIRDEKKFDSIDELRNQLLKDIETTKNEMITYKDFVESTSVLWDKKLFNE